MACQINLRTLVGAQSAESNGGQWTAGVAISGLSVNNGAPTAYGVGDILPTDNPTLDVSNVPSNTVEVPNYTFIYTLGGDGCNSIATVTITVVNGVVASSDRGFTVCPTNNQAYNLWNFLLGGGIDGATGVQTAPPLPANEVTATDGVNYVHGAAVPNTPLSNGWAVTSGSPGGGYVIGANPPFSNTFNPNGLSTPATIIFTYSVKHVSGSSSCPNCTDSATVTFNIVAAPNAGSNASVTLCNDATLVP
jgi:hypothetical protein